MEGKTLAILQAMIGAIVNDFGNLIKKAAEGDDEAIGALAFEASMFLFSGDEGRFFFKGGSLKMRSKSGIFSIAKNENDLLSTGIKGEATISLRHFDNRKSIEAVVALDKNGYLNGLIVKSPASRKAKVTNLTEDVLDISFEFYGDKIKGFKTQWGEIIGYGKSSNLNLYEQALADGLTEQQAAFKTISGQWAKKNGFTKAKKLKSDSNNIEFLFTKPNN